MNTKEKLAIPTSREFLEMELTSATLARTWRNLEIHFVQKHLHPYVITEVNRISTVMFHLDEMDGDIYDDTYTYIVVYDRVHGEIVAFYRYILCKDAIKSKHDVRLSTSTYFNFSDEFVEKILPVTIELGRSVVNKVAKSAEVGLQAIWMGLGILVYEYHKHPKDIKIEYFFGKFSIQWNVYDEATRNIILYLFKRHFPPMIGSDGELYVKPKFEYETKLDFTEAEKILYSDQYKIDKKIVTTYLKNIGLQMPKLAEAYANLGGLKSFGTIFNNHLKSWETAILQKIDEIDPFYIKKFCDGYEPKNILF